MKNSMRIILAGLSLLSPIIAANAAPGDLDPTFGSGGRVITNFGFAGASDVVIQPDAKIIAVGENASGSGVTIGVARYNPDGSLDSTFGSGGKVETTVGQFSAASSIALLPDGRIVVGGSTCVLGPVCDFVVVRYMQDGSLDASFDVDGIAVVDFLGNDDRGNDIEIQPDGKIVIIGGSGGPSSRNYAFAVARLNVDGTPDATFDLDGQKITSLGAYSDSGASAVAIQPDARIILAGQRGIGPGYSPTDFALVRYNPDGELDPTFDDDGIVITDVVNYGEGFSDITLQPDGKVIGVGSTADLAAVIRYESDGSLDTDFGSAGVTLTDIGAYDFFSAVVIQPNGKIVAGGYNSEHTIARYTTDGQLDVSFGGDGIVTTDFDDMGYPDGYPYGGIGGLAVDADGKIVGVGSWGLDGEFSVFALARYLGDPVIRTRFDFDGDGRADISVFRPSDSIWYLNRSQAGFAATRFGIGTDQIAPGDFDNDGSTDIAVFRDGVWWWINSSDGTVAATRFGQAGDKPVTADFSGDGRDELAVYRDGEWWFLDLASGQTRVITFGTAADVPVPADYDRDRRADLAVYRNGEWHINRSTLGYLIIRFGDANDTPVVGDYDGDGKYDPAVYRDGVWYILRSGEGFQTFQFGLATDTPVPADYDGDGKFDPAVFRDGTWYVLQDAGGIVVHQFGSPGDEAIAAAFQP